MKSFRYNHVPRISNELEKKIGIYFLKHFRIHFMPLKPHEIKGVIVKFKLPRDKKSVNIIKSIRHTYLVKFTVIQTHRLINKSIESICKSIESKQNIMELSRHYRYPPMSLLRMYRKYRKLPKSSLTIPPLIQMVKIAEEDVVNQDTMKKSLKFEKRIQHWLDKHGILYKTQDELVSEASNLTPDFLLKNPIVIDGQKIFWIDAKNQFGTPSFYLSKLRKQADKYNKAFGTGAMIFSSDFNPKLNEKIENTVFLDFDGIMD